MSMSFRLDLKQTQGLVLTPQLQQAIKLLQYSNQELVDAVATEASGNPFIQVIDPGSSAPARNRIESTSQEPTQASNVKAGTTPAASDSRMTLRSLSGHSQDADLPSLAERLTEKPSLLKHLTSQLMAARGDKETVRLAALLASQLDGDGYLRQSDRELAEQLGTDQSLVTAARRLLQSCEPVGIAARDLSECLALQLAERDRLDPAMQKLIDRLPLLARADWAGLMRSCGVDREDLEEMVQEIKALDPRPGSAFFGEDVDAVIPDMFVLPKPGGGWRVELNNRALPRVLVDETYAAELSSKDGEVREFIREKLQDAGWLQKALEQRARTMIRVAGAIFQHQQSFLEDGPKALRPLVLRDIAKVTSLHESTVSRATAEKYVQTPRGTFPLKYFFTTAIQSADQSGDHSAEAIRSKISDMIQAESPDAVLSDDQVVSSLKAQGVVIARRTVAKYRESLRIPSSVQRRRAKALAR